MREIIPGIYQLRLPTKSFPPGHTNAYLVRGDEGYLLVDTGWDTEEILNYIQKEIAEIGISLKEITQIVLTHSHTDHAGLAGRLRHLFPVRIYLHQRGIDTIKFRFTYNDSYCQDNFYPQTDRFLQVHGVPPSQLEKPDTLLPEMRWPPLPDVPLHGGETISTGNFNFQVLWTPGHSPGHISLYEPNQKILISGDVILPTITTNIGFHLQLSNNPLGDYLNSLDKIKNLDISFVLPGHEKPFSNVMQRVAQLVQKHEDKNEEILSVISDYEPKTAYEISLEISRAPGTRRPMWPDFTPLDKRFTVLENVAHLEAMRFQGRASRLLKDSTVYYHLLKEGT